MGGKRCVDLPVCHAWVGPGALELATWHLPGWTFSTLGLCLALPDTFLSTLNSMLPPTVKRHTGSVAVGESGRGLNANLPYEGAGRAGRMLGGSARSFCAMLLAHLEDAVPVWVTRCGLRSGRSYSRHHLSIAALFVFRLIDDDVVSRRPDEKYSGAGFRVANDKRRCRCLAAFLPACTNDMFIWHVYICCCSSF